MNVERKLATIMVAAWRRSKMAHATMRPHHN